jgi:Spy/CpxP family protein refolding chaperone
MFTILALGTALVFAPGAFAQAAEEQESPEKLQKELGLTDDQKNQIKTIQQQAREQTRAVREDTSLTREQKAEKIREINRNTNTQVRSVLTPEQYERYQRRARERRENVRERKEGRRDDSRERKPDRRRRP